MQLRTYTVQIQSVILFLAHGSVSFGQDTATIELYSNTEGTFEFSLDDAAFLQCMQLIYIFICILYVRILSCSYVLGYVPFIGNSPRKTTFVKFGNLSEYFLPKFCR